MRYSSKLLVAPLLAAMGMAAGSAQAGDGSAPGWYLGGDVGRSEIEVDNGADSSDTAFAVHGGYRVTRYFAIEASYADLGGVDYSVACPSDVCVPERYPQQIDVSAERLDMAVLGIIPFGERWEAYAKLGIARTQVDTKVRSLLVAGDFSDDSADLIHGVGLRVHLDTPWSLRLQWERIADVNDSNTNIDALWLGAEYRFGG